MKRKWPNLRVRSKKHQLTPSPDDSRNVRQKKDNKSSDEESDDDSHITEELRDKFLKIKVKNKKNKEKDNFTKVKGKKNKNKKVT